MAGIFKGQTLNSVMKAVEEYLPVVIQARFDSAFDCIYDDKYSLEELCNYSYKLKSDEDFMAQGNGYITWKGLESYIRFYAGKIGTDIPTSTVEEELQNKEFLEGTDAEKRGIRYERDANARKKCIDHYGCKCAVCGMDFEKTYGELGKGFIEVHHIIPISQRGGEYEVNPIKDLVPLCSNCHSMIHRTKGEPLSIENLRSLFKKDL